MDDVTAMRQALDQARLSPPLGDVPVGAVVLASGEIVSAAHNQREFRADPTAHAEILAIQAAVASLRRSELADCTLVVTLEPCVMCAGALLAAGIGRLVFAAYDPKAGACGSRYNLVGDPRLGLEIPTLGGVLEDEASVLLSSFFSSLRATRAGVEPVPGT